MAKVKTTFFCQNCGTQYAKWQGQCSSCKSWKYHCRRNYSKGRKTRLETIGYRVKKSVKTLKN